MTNEIISNTKIIVFDTNELKPLSRDPPATGDGRYGPGTLYGLWPRSRWTWTRADTKEANTMHLISLVNSITKNMNLVIC
jgi:hypothetical protein